ncbi:hypothetical protein HDV00_003465 [Rhizophlyctis rosea]|nr:hypothetical protein HDV00_003465 [Rhizophlyctis rosea]
MSRTLTQSVPALAGGAVTVVAPQLLKATNRQRSYSDATTIPKPTPSEQPAANVGPASPSSCPEGTVLKGINMFKGGADPVAKADKDYPDWLWTILEPKKTEFEEHEKFSREYLRHVAQQKIKDNALAKKMGVIKKNPRDKRKYSFPV